MVTNKELLEAAAFRRRRLVAALLTGSSYDEPARAFRPVVAGVAVALVAGAAGVVGGYLGVR
jgi:hypothetical protein